MVLIQSLLLLFFVEPLSANGFQLPSAAQRAAWEEVHGVQYPASFDELDKDLFWIRKTSGSSETLVQTYPWYKHQTSDFLSTTGDAAVSLLPESSASLGGDILFFDLNFSPEEVRQIREVARIRGVRAFVYPKRTDQQQRRLEEQYVAVVAAQDRLKACAKRNSGSCERELEGLEEKSGAMAKFVEQEIGRFEQKQFSETLADLQSRGISPTVLVFSGHSGGGTSFGGFLGALTSDSVHEEIGKYPQWKRNIRSIMLWGCYGGTLNGLNNVWKKNYPDLGLLVGYRGQSPLGHRPVSGRFLRNVLAQEKPLLEARNPRAAHRLFRAIPDVAALDGTALLAGYYLTYGESAPVEELLARCQELTEEKVNQYRCYRDGSPGCEDPPSDHRGPLRDLYSYLQKNQHCSELLTEKFKDLPSTDFLIRLIYLREVKSNLARVRAQELAKYKAVEAEAGVGTEFQLGDFSRTKRSQDQRYFLGYKSEAARLGMLDGSFTDDKTAEEVKSKVRWNEASFSLNMALLLEGAQWQGHCIPLTWVDLGAREKDRCGIEFFLSENLGAAGESRILRSYFNAVYSRWSDEFSPMLVFHSIDQQNLRSVYKMFLEIRLQSLKAAPSTNEKTLRLVEGLERRLKALPDLSEEELRAQVRRELEKSIAEAKRIIEVAGSLPFSSEVVSQFEFFEKRLEEMLKALEGA